jgi:hypothetical protein
MRRAFELSVVGLFAWLWSAFCCYICFTVAWQDPLNDWLMWLPSIARPVVFALGKMIAR